MLIGDSFGTFYMDCLASHVIVTNLVKRK